MATKKGRTFGMTALGALGTLLQPRRKGPKGGPSLLLAALAKKSNRSVGVDIDRYQETSGLGQTWARRVYGDYYATSVPVYSAIKIRAEALTRPPVLVYRTGPTTHRGEELAARPRII